MKRESWDICCTMYTHVQFSGVQEYNEVLYIQVEMCTKKRL